MFYTGLVAIFTLIISFFGYFIHFSLHNQNAFL